jgi:GNAT superfamily N-acetyltransferase
MAMILTDIHNDADSIEFKVTSEKSVLNISSLDESIEAILEDNSPECKYFTNFRIDLYAVDGMGEVLADIGFLTGTSIEAEITFTDGYSFKELCDMISTDLYLMAEDICGKDGHVRKSICPPDYNIMYIENMYIEEKYRGMGIGKYLLDNAGGLFSRSLNYSHHTFILKPFPQVKSGEHGLRDSETATKDEKKRLINFYEKAGYKFINGSEYMCKIQANELFDMLGFYGEETP